MIWPSASTGDPNSTWAIVSDTIASRAPAATSAAVNADPATTCRPITSR